MKCLIIFTFLLIFFVFQGYSQTTPKYIPKNLVPNPSFEHLIHLPLQTNSQNYFECEPLSGFVPFQRNMAFWKSANKNTPDLRIVQGKDYSCLKRRFDYAVKPRKGKAMVGIMTYMSNYSSDTYREYIQVKLKEVVKPGIKTYVELYICKDRKAKLISNNIGFYFSQRPIEKDIRENLEVTPQFNESAVINQDTQKWERVFGWFIPNKPYIYLTIGNFYDNTKTIQKESEHHSAHERLQSYAQYLIDDVRVWQENDTLEEAPEYDLTSEEPFRLKHVNFEFDSAELLSSSFTELNKLLNFMRKNPQLRIAIHGHTDNVGDDDFNLKLSNRRAEAVKNYLINNGIKEIRLQSQGFGESKPVTTNATSEGRLENRRVEFIILEQKITGRGR